MAASILYSPRAVQVSIEHRVTGHDEDLKAIVRAIRQLAEPPLASRRRIGFRGGEVR